MRARRAPGARVALRLTALSLSLLVAVLVTPRREVRCQKPSCGWGLSPSTSGQHNRGHSARPVSADPSGQSLCGSRASESIINAICRNESIPLKRVFEQVLEKTLRWRAGPCREECCCGQCLEGCLSYGKPGARPRAEALCKGEASRAACCFFLSLPLSVFQQLEEGRLSEFVVHT